jgi:hypothetical protein
LLSSKTSRHARVQPSPSLLAKTNDLAIGQGDEQAACEGGEAFEDRAGDPFPVFVPDVMRESDDDLPAGPEGGAKPRPQDQPAG